MHSVLDITEFWWTDAGDTGMIRMCVSCQYQGGHLAIGADGMQLRKAG